MKSIEGSAETLTNARRSYCASVKEEERNHPRVTQLEGEESLSAVPFRLTVGGGLVLGRRMAQRREFHFMHVTTIFCKADLARLRKI